MGLVQVSTNTVTSAVASVTLTGIDSDDVYVVMFNNVIPVSDAQKLTVKFTVSGTADSSANYDHAQKVVRSGSSFGNQSNTNQTSINSLDQGGTGTQESLQGIHYLYNFNNASEYSFMTYEGTARSSIAELNARQGGGVLTETQSTDGVQYSFASGNIASGTFTLYKVT
jgi:hypothetical protein